MKKILIIALLALLTVTINCGGGGGSSTDMSAKTMVTINLGGVRDGSSLSASERGVVSTSSIPPHVVSIRITISAPDMPTIQEVIPTAGQTAISVTIEVPNGPSRHIVVDANNATGGALYSSQTYVTLDGTPVSLNMYMAADPTPPSFAGISDITSITQTSMVLWWSPATDNVTPQNKIQYLIYMATTSGGQNFTSPSFTTTPGATSYTVTGLNPNTTYYYVVLAMDEVGNKSATIVEASGKTLPPPDPNPPTFGGLESATAISQTEIELQWSEATDDVTPSPDIVYLIYMATTSGGQNFATPTATTSPGVTSYTVTGLSPDTLYCFVVRARDAAGNTDPNIVEHCDSTPSAPPELSISPLTVTIIALPNPDSAGSDNVTFTVDGMYPPFNVTSSNTSVIPNPGVVPASGGTFTIDPDQDCSTTLVTLNVTDSDSGSMDATVNLNIPPFTSNLSNSSICENNSTCPAGTDFTSLILTGVPPFTVTSSQPTVIPDPGMSLTDTYTIDAINGSITADTLVSLTSSSYCDAGPNVSSVTVIDQVDYELRPLNDGVDATNIWCDVENTGTLDAVNVTVWFDYNDSCACFACTPTIVTTISAGGTETVSIPHSGCAFTPTNYRIIVDPNDVFPESDETNNCVDSGTLLCTNPPPASCP